MEEQFAKIMAAKTDRELIEIATVDKNKYQPEAIEAANKEMESRNIDPRKPEAIAEKVADAKIQSDVLTAVRASTGIRFANGLIDTVLFFIVFVFLTGIIASFRWSGMGNGIASWTALLAWLFFYYGFMEYRFQKTFAKMLTGTKVVMADGTKPGLNDALMRTVCRLIPFDGLSYLLAKNGFHDKFSNTIVIKDTL